MSWKRCVENRKRYSKAFSSHPYASGVFVTEKSGKLYYRRRYRSPHRRSRFSFCKRQSDKQLRRINGTVGNGGNFKKAYDLWWTVF